MEFDPGEWWQRLVDAGYDVKNMSEQERYQAMLETGLATGADMVTASGAGLGAIGTLMSGGSLADSVGVINQAFMDRTFEPDMSPEGEIMYEGLATAMEPVEAGIKALGHGTLDATGSPEAATMAEILAGAMIPGRRSGRTGQRWYRGEHGEVGEGYTTRDVPVFSEDPAVASIYAESPNSLSDPGGNARVYPVTSNLRKPAVLNEEGDPFVDFGMIEEIVGEKKAREIWLDDDANIWGGVQNTNRYHELYDEGKLDIPVGEEIPTEVLRDTYTDFYHVAHSPMLRKELKKQGYDGIEGTGNTEGFDSRELWPFEESGVSSIFEPEAPMKNRRKIRGSKQNAFPGIYKDPRQIADEVQVAPESPYLAELFGVTRADLAETANRAGNITDPQLPGAAAKPKGAASADAIMTPGNERRINDALYEAKDRRPELWEGMKGWYVMDPAYRRLEELYGPDEAVRLYNDFNAFTGMASPGSDVITEFNRGTAANMLYQNGRWSEFVAGGGQAGRIQDAEHVRGHPYHSTAQAGPMGNYVEDGRLPMSPKVPMYIQAAGVPETGFQTRIPVGDAHWSRATGLADVRGAKNFGASVSTPEMQALAPWWRDKIAGQHGLESVPAQAITWGLFGKQTGVDTPVGAPKLELLADEIMKASMRTGIDPETMRDLILSGQAYAGGPLKGN